VSDECVTLVELSVGEAEAADRADAVLRWLLDLGVIVPNPRRGDPWRDSAFVPGPRAPEAAPDLARVSGDGSDMGVDILVERELYRDTTPHEAPRCPECGHEQPDAVLDDLIRPWLDGREPELACQRCGAARPLGDWPDGFLVGELAVRFNNWPPLSDEFVATLGQRLGPRWRAIHEHY
jgi:hypothetical protein